MTQTCFPLMAEAIDSMDAISVNKDFNVVVNFIILVRETHSSRSVDGR